MDRNSPATPCRPLDELEAEITELAGHLNAAQHRWLTLIAEFDRRKGWSDGACHSCAHWLNFQCGVALGAAREKVRVAHALERLPKISAALNGGERHQIVVHVDAETLRHGTAGRCEIEHGPALPAETVRRLGCDCSAVILLENAQGEPLDVGRRTRTIPPALRRALNARDQGCRFPGCTHTRYVQAHHVRHWAHGVETKASNLITLCSAHHRRVHEGGVHVQVLDDGAFRFVRPDGRAFEGPAPARGQPFDGSELQRHPGGDLHINRHTAITRWRGERMDYGLAIEVLLAQARGGQESSRGNA